MPPKIRKYQADRLLRQAVERNFEIIGEAISRLVKDDPLLADRISNHRQIIGFRNLLIHGYAVVDDSRVWAVVQNDLPQFEKEIRELLAELDP